MKVWPIFRVSVASVYPHYVTKADKKDRTRAEVDEVIRWLTGFDPAALNLHLQQETTFPYFFAAATLSPAADKIIGSVCGVKVQDVEDPLMRRIRMLDKLVDQLAKGRPIGKHPAPGRSRTADRSGFPRGVESDMC